MMEELCYIVATKHSGSLKGEHGTGRNVAPFVEMEWGTKVRTPLHLLVSCQCARVCALARHAHTLCVQKLPSLRKPAASAA